MEEEIDILSGKREREKRKKNIFHFLLQVKITSLPLHSLSETGSKKEGPAEGWNLEKVEKLS
ncbi:hypothetical protein C900_01207 [Fulvivirga imtechensis AK7]|uniref:Uncharacterized protein n=1 Tax=Fulvivirga imtechensis AK7 TaxID=1237149 RepID=L8JKK4_9BACT|nr:hypothetical protein C900_01207 [Fulvivirga imtechensis AK7]